MLASSTSLWLVVPGAVLAGFVAGMLSGLLGIGGAVVSTPMVRLLGGTPIEAVGSTVPAIIPGALSGAWRFSREGLVQWRIAITLGVSGSVMAVVGALASDAVNGRLLMVLTALMMLWAGGSVVWRLRHPRVATPRDTATPGETATAGETATPGETVRGPSGLLVGALGVVAGFTAGLLGVGGGIIVVPVLSGPLRLPMRQAVASSLVAVAVFQVPALVTHVWLGHVNWAIAVPLTLGAVPGAQVGAKLTVAASDRTIQVLFATLVVVIAVIYGVTEVRGLLAGG